MSIKVTEPVVVITPTIGLDSLTKAIESVKAQTYRDIRHLIVVDGPEYFEKVMSKIAIKFNDDNEHNHIMITALPTNTGSNGFYGHRIYAAFPHLVNEPYIAFLDEDNWYEPNHIETLVNKIEKDDLRWAHSLRNVYLHESDGGGFLDKDCCEAIGRWPIAWFDSPQHLVDTSSYMFRAEFIKIHASLWHWGWGGDRRFFTIIKDKGKYDTTGEHTLNYRLPPIQKAYGGDKDIFKKGNEIILKQYGAYPWTKV